MSNLPHSNIHSLIHLEYMDVMIDFMIVTLYEVINPETIAVYEYVMSDGEFYSYLQTGIIEAGNPKKSDYQIQTSKSEKENLLIILEQIVEYYRFLYGIPLVSSFTEVIDEADWKKILTKITTKTTTTFDSAFIEFLRKSGLNPQPFDEEKGQWTAKCVSGGNHRMMIDAYLDEFGCGYCRRKGGQNELEEWIAEKKNKKQSNEK